MDDEEVTYADIEDQIDDSEEATYADIEDQIDDSKEATYADIENRIDDSEEATYADIEDQIDDSKEATYADIENRIDDSEEATYADIEDQIDDSKEATYADIENRIDDSDCNIYRVPTLMFKENPKAYIPRMVSIGPMHHDQKHLQPMIIGKMQYFENFLCRSSPRKLRKYIKVMTDLEERACRCYPEVNIKKERFVMMMVVDGCFILELLLKHKKHKDHYFSRAEMDFVESCLLDLILVENQLPFFVLEELYSVFIGDYSHSRQATTCTLQDVICQSLVSWVMQVLFDSDLDETTNCANAFNKIQPERKPEHLLDFVRQFIVPSFSTIQSQQQEEMINYGKNKQNPVVKAARCLLYPELACVLRLWIKKEDNLAKGYKLAEPMRCATELKNANVKFEKNKNPTSLLDINFDCAMGVLTIPPLHIQDNTEPILRNLLAYEFYYDDNRYITEYTIFLSNLINSGKDVELLRESEIFLAVYAQPIDVAKLFHSVTKNTIGEFACTNMVSRKLMKYSNRRWNKWKATLMLNYFNTSWALVSVIVAIFLLVLTFTQTIFAVLSCHSIDCCC